jgi:hypothetical protein
MLLQLKREGFVQLGSKGSWTRGESMASASKSKIEGKYYPLKTSFFELRLRIRFTDRAFSGVVFGH